MVNESQFLTVNLSSLTPNMELVRPSQAAGCAHHLAAMQMGALVYLGRSRWADYATAARCNRGTKGRSEARLRPRNPSKNKELTMEILGLN